MDRSALDDHTFPPLAELVSSWIEGVGETARRGGDALIVNEIALDLPFEMQIGTAADGNAIAIAASPPTQRTETTVLPVWHRLAVRFVLGED